MVSMSEIIHPLLQSVLDVLEKAERPLTSLEVHHARLENNELSYTPTMAQTVSLLIHLQGRGKVDKVPKELTARWFRVEKGVLDV